MRKTYLLLYCLGFWSLIGRAQTQDSIPAKRHRVKQTDIELVYNHYNQDGLHSAVTGGTGTEKLDVFAPALKIKHSFGHNTINFNGGADIITSASTDKIDFIVSSASSRDARAYVNIGYGRSFRDDRLKVEIGTGGSYESDYLSISANASASYTEKNKMRTYNGSVQLYFDDLRWGLGNEKYHRLEKLIYPSELRYKNWFDIYQRQSYNFRLGFSQVLNKRNVLGIFPEFTYQTGLLSTPFHRIYFSDDTKAVENLPRQRIKGAIALRLNSFAGGNVIVRNAVQGYTDDFGITGIAIEHETAIKLNAQWVLTPFGRFYIQQASRYFAPYKEHAPTETFYTSDYDLSAFSDFKAGIGLKYTLDKFWSKRFQYNSIALRYAYYRRSDGLAAHIVSVAFGGRLY